MQIRHPEMHTSCAGRGEQDQEELFLRGSTKAHFRESAHNWNCALDIFVQKSGLYIYDKNWFNTVIKPVMELGAMPQFLKWYGAPGSPFFELPHIELNDWRILVPTGMISLVK